MAPSCTEIIALKYFARSLLCSSVATGSHYEIGNAMNQPADEASRLPGMYFTVDMFLGLRMLTGHAGALHC